jgi:carbon monoxide dehydrogenase subunit G
MEITGTSTIAAPVQAVWNALNDPDILRRCLPGCETVERTGPEDFRIVMTASVGPLRARFNGKLRMTDAQPPTRCVLQFEGQGGAMGFGKGMSTVSLREVPEGTELTYTAQAQVGGKLAQVGSRLIDGVARKMSDDFFNALRLQLAPEPAAQPVPAAEPVTQPAPRTGPAQGSTMRSAPAEAATAASAVSTAGPAPVHTAPAVARAEAAAYLVPAWWLGLAASLGAIAAIAGGLLLR